VFEANITIVLIVSLIVLVALGVHIAIALGIASAIGVFLVTGGNIQVVQKMLASTAYEALRDYVFAVIPLFMLMGEFIAKSGAVTDVYKAINRGLKRIPGRLAIATVLGNAIFSFVTGVSIASAAAFSRIAYPQMKKFGYHRGFALGTVAGSSCLGMLIPPSVLMIVWGLLTEKSIGQIFLAGVLPGFLLVVLFIAYILIMAIFKPEVVGGGRDAIVAEIEDEEIDSFAVWTSAIGIISVVVAVLGGIWFGIFTPTEGAGAGAAIGLLLGLIKGMKWRDVVDCILSVLGTGLLPWMIIAMMIGIWFLLGMVIDSISIMLLTVTIFEPIAIALGYDPIAFAIIGIIAIEAGLLTPPFGLLVYTVKAALPEEKDITVMQIFKSSTPYWIIMLIAMVMIAIFPEIATYLPKLVF
jgi:C4-dicarboxylate transporter DctM subunit